MADALEGGLGVVVRVGGLGGLDLGRQNTGGG